MVRQLGVGLGRPNAEADRVPATRNDDAAAGEDAWESVALDNGAAGVRGDGLLPVTQPRRPGTIPRFCSHSRPVEHSCHRYDAHTQSFQGSSEASNQPPPLASYPGMNGGISSHD